MKVQVVLGTFVHRFVKCLQYIILYLNIILLCHELMCAEALQLVHRRDTYIWSCNDKDLLYKPNDLCVLFLSHQLQGAHLLNCIQNHCK